MFKKLLFSRVVGERLTSVAAQGVQLGGLTYTCSERVTTVRSATSVTSRRRPVTRTLGVCCPASCLPRGRAERSHHAAHDTPGTLCLRTRSLNLLPSPPSPTPTPGHPESDLSKNASRGRFPGTGAQETRDSWPPAPSVLSHAVRPRVLLDARALPRSDAGRSGAHCLAPLPPDARRTSC